MSIDINHNWDYDGSKDKPVWIMTLHWFDGGEDAYENEEYYRQNPIKWRVEVDPDPEKEGEDIINAFINKFELEI